VNVVGSLVLGLLAGFTLTHTGGTTAKTVVGTGFCGGLTTWSTASWETVRLAEEGAGGTAVRFTLANLLASFAAGGAGILVLGA
jgi:CrcB protein